MSVGKTSLSKYYAGRTQAPVGRHIEQSLRLAQRSVCAVAVDRGNDLGLSERRDGGGETHTHQSFRNHDSLELQHHRCHRKSSRISPRPKLTLLQSALVAGVISGAFSWYNIEQTHWTVKAVWYSGLVFAFASISATGLCSASLLRLQCHSQSTAQIRAVVGYQKSGSSPWKARPLQPWIWGSPGLLLKVSIVLFVVGLAIDLWNIALTAELPGLTADLKVNRLVLTISMRLLRKNRLPYSSPARHLWRWQYMSLRSLACSTERSAMLRRTRHRSMIQFHSACLHNERRISHSNPCMVSFIHVLDCGNSFSSPQKVCGSPTYK